MTFSDKKRKNRLFNVPMYDRIGRSLILKLAWKSFQALKFSSSLTFSEFRIKCWNFLTFPWFFGQISNSLTFPSFPGFSKLRSNPAVPLNDQQYHWMIAGVENYLRNVWVSFTERPKEFRFITIYGELFFDEYRNRDKLFF